MPSPEEEKNLPSAESQQAASQDAPKGPIRWIVQADYHMASENRPCDTEGRLLRTVGDALMRGASEIRIRPYAQLSSDVAEKVRAYEAQIAAIDPNRKNLQTS